MQVKLARILERDTRWLSIHCSMRASESVVEYRVQVGEVYYAAAVPYANLHLHFNQMKKERKTTEDLLQFPWCCLKIDTRDISLQTEVAPTHRAKVGSC